MATELGGNGGTGVPEHREGKVGPMGPSGTSLGNTETPGVPLLPESSIGKSARVSSQPGAQVDTPGPLAPGLSQIRAQAAEPTVITPPTDAPDAPREALDSENELQEPPEGQPGLHKGWKFVPRKETDAAGKEKDRWELFHLVTGIIDTRTGAVGVVGTTKQDSYLLDHTYKPVAHLRDVFSDRKQFEGLDMFTVPQNGIDGEQLARLATEEYPDITEHHLAGADVLGRDYERRQEVAAQRAERPENPKYLPQEWSLPDIKNSAKIFPKVKEENGKYMLEEPAYGHEQYGYSQIALAMDNNNGCIVPIGVLEDTDNVVIINPRTFEPLSPEIDFFIGISPKDVGYSTPDGRVLSVSGRDETTAIKIHAKWSDSRVVTRLIHEQLVAASTDSLSETDSQWMSPAGFAAGFGVDPKKISWGFTAPYENKMMEALKDKKFEVPGLEQDRILSLNKIRGREEEDFPVLDENFAVFVVDAGGRDQEGNYHDISSFDLAIDRRTRTVGSIGTDDKGKEYLFHPGKQVALTPPGVDEILAMGTGGVLARTGQGDKLLTTMVDVDMSAHTIHRIDITDHMHEGGLTGADMQRYAEAVAGSGVAFKPAFYTAITYPHKMKMVGQVSETAGREITPTMLRIESFTFPPFDRDADGKWKVRNDDGTDTSYDEVNWMIDKHSGFFALVGYSAERNTNTILGPDLRNLGLSEFSYIKSLNLDSVVGLFPSDQATGIYESSPGNYGNSAKLISSGTENYYGTNIVVYTPVPEELALGLNMRLGIQDMKGKVPHAQFAFEEAFKQQWANQLLDKAGVPALPSPVIALTEVADPREPKAAKVVTEETFKYSGFMLNKDNKPSSGGRTYDSVKIYADANGIIALVGTRMVDGRQVFEIFDQTQDPMVIAMTELLGLEEEAYIGRDKTDGHLIRVELEGGATMPKIGIGRREKPAKDRLTPIDVPLHMLQEGISLEQMKELAAIATGRDKDVFKFAFWDSYAVRLGQFGKETQVSGEVLSFIDAFHALSEKRGGAVTELPDTHRLPKMRQTNTGHLTPATEDGGESFDALRALSSLKLVVDPRTGLFALKSTFEKNDYLVNPTDFSRMTPAVDAVHAFEPDGIVVRVGRRRVGISDKGIQDLGMADPGSNRMLEIPLSPGFLTEGTITMGQLKQWVRESNLAEVSDPQLLQVPGWNEQSRIYNLQVGKGIPHSERVALLEQPDEGFVRGYHVAVDTDSHQVALLKVAVADADPISGRPYAEPREEYYVVDAETGAPQTPVGLDEVISFGDDGVTGLLNGGVVKVRNGQIEVFDTLFDPFEATVKTTDVTEQIARKKLTGPRMIEVAADMVGGDEGKFKLVQPTGEAQAEIAHRTFRELTPRERVSELIDALGAVSTVHAVDLNDNLQHKTAVMEGLMFLISVQGADEGDIVDAERLSQGARHTSERTWEYVRQAAEAWEQNPDMYDETAAIVTLIDKEPGSDEYTEITDVLRVPDMSTFQKNLRKLQITHRMQREQRPEGVPQELFSAVVSMRGARDVPGEVGSLAREGLESSAGLLKDLYVRVYGRGGSSRNSRR